MHFARMGTRSALTAAGSVGISCLGRLKCVKKEGTPREPPCVLVAPKTRQSRDSKVYGGKAYQLLYADKERKALPRLPLAFFHPKANHQHQRQLDETIVDWDPYLRKLLRVAEKNGQEEDFDGRFSPAFMTNCSRNGTVEFSCTFEEVVQCVGESSRQHDRFLSIE